MNIGPSVSSMQKYEGYKSDPESKALFSKNPSTYKLVKSIEEKYAKGKNSRELDDSKN